MSNKQDSVLELLRKLRLSTDEAKVYVELLKSPSTHLKLAHATGVNRTKVYRLADQLEKRGLVASRSDDRGTFLVAADAATLEVDLVAQEEKVKGQRAAFETLVPMLASIKSGDASQFIVHNYDGEDGFKQMLWHELKTKGENLIFGHGTIEDLVPNRAWAEKHRALTTETNYKVREVINPGGKKTAFTLNEEFMKNNYCFRLIDPAIIEFQQQIAIYNDTVAIYNRYDAQKVGVEIVNAAYANTMRQVFEHYWQLAKEPNT